jgi:hypothetical protein
MSIRKLSRPKYEIVGELERFDEADNVQARGEMQPGTDLWEEYYRKHPGLEEQGKSWRKLPGMGHVGPPADNLMVAAMMGTVKLMSRDEDLDGMPSPDKFTFTPERAAEKLKGFARHLGAELVGIGPLNQAWVYSRVGRSHYPGKVIGPEIKLPHDNALVVAIHLNPDLVNCAPQLPSNIEVFKTYLRLAGIVNTLARYIRLLGYSARAHDVENYQVLAVPIAIDAGLGELGRNGVLVTEEYGNAVKLAVVTTDMPLAHDKPVDIGVAEFCEDCKICGYCCPVGAIPITREKKVIRGVRKWKLNDPACYSYWMTVGNDCGICLSVCPWSRPRSFPHNLVQWGVQHVPAFRKLAVAIDTRRSKKRHACPAWMEKQDQSWRDTLHKGHPFRE